MTVYFDKENYTNYLTVAEETEIGRDSLRMVKKQLNVHLNFEREVLDEYEVILLEEFQDGVSKDFKLTLGENKVDRPLKKDSFPSARGVYLLNDDKIGSAKLLKTHLIGGLNEEVDTLKMLFISNDYSFHKLKEIGVEVTPANHLDIFDMPFSTVVVVDRYIFKGPEIGGNLSLYDFNLAKILKKIYIAKKGPSKIILIYQVNVKVKTTDPMYDEGPDIIKLATKIRNVTEKHCVAPELYFIGVPHGYIDDEHDRYILTDFIKIKSGDSLVYFNSKGETITKSKTVDSYSLANHDYRKIILNLVKKLNIIAKETLSKHGKYSKVPTGVNIDALINFS